MWPSPCLFVALSFCGKVKLASAEVLWGWNWMVAVGDDESVNLYISRCSKLVYIELSYYFVPTAVLKKERSGLRD